MDFNSKYGAENIKKLVTKAPKTHTLCWVLRKIRNAALLGEEALQFENLKEEWKSALKALGYEVEENVVSWNKESPCRGCFWANYHDIPCGREFDSKGCKTYWKDLNEVAILCNAFGTHLDNIYKNWMVAIRKGEWNND